MVEPVLALTVAAVLAIAVTVLLWPSWGLFWRMRRSIRLTERTRIEDALKHLYDCESRKLPCTLQSLAGAIAMSGSRTAGLLGRLERLGLVESSEGRYSPTDDGRSYALRVIRIHRLWERYLADETGVDAAEWHAEAEYREHRMSQAEADALAARMGSPRYDPHGDPIPTASGEIAPPRGKPLTDLPPGRVAEIVHVEDEPHEVYTQILAEKIHPGMRVRVSVATPTSVRFEADDEEHVLAPVVAANLWAVPLPEPERELGPTEKLSALEPGEQANVVGISAACRGPERRRMLDLGIIPGTVVEAELRSPGGDPTAYRIRGTLIALRREQADLIHVDRRHGAAAR